MLGLPKIAVARLKARGWVSHAADGPAKSTVFQGADHPDANLLSAFGENTLSEKERGQMLEHLIECGACREVAALSGSAEGVDAEPARLAASRGSAWPVLRWGALTALVGTLTVVLVLHPGYWTRHVQIAQRMQRPMPSDNVPSAPTPIIEPSATPPLADLSAKKAKPETLESVSRGKLVPHPPPENDELGAQTQLLLRPAMAVAPKPGAAVTSTRLLGMSRRETLGMAATAASGPRLSALSPRPAGESMAAAANLGVEPPSRGDRRSASNSRGDGGEAKPSPSVGNAAQPAVRSTSPMMAQARMGALQASTRHLEMASSPAMTLWNVSADGNIQRLNTGGTAWERVHVANGVAFRAVAALGNDIWAGGSGGALFHSPDAGATWARVDINVQGNTVTEIITGLQASDATHVTVKTASGSEWVSDDGGRHWQKRP